MKLKLLILYTGLFLLNIIIIHTGASAQTLRVRDTTYHGFRVVDSIFYTNDEVRSRVFGNLNFSSINTGYLLDKGLTPFIPALHDGRGTDDSVLTTSSWFQVYAALQIAGVNTSANLKIPDSIQAYANVYLKQRMVPIAVVNRSYQYIRSDAIAIGCFTASTDSTILYDNPSRTVNPYLLSRFFAGSPVFPGSSYASSGDVKFVLPRTMFQTDTLNTRVQIDFGDGAGYREVDFDEPVTVNYSASGNKTIRISQDGLYTTATFYFQKRDVFYYTDNEAPGTAFTKEIPVDEEDFRTLGVVAGATWTPFLGCDHTLNKPVLLVEGLNIEDNPDPQEILNRTDRGTSLFSRLMNLGYDVCVVKFKNNLASIETNAAALENVINDINAQKIGTENLTVIGLSMGGLVSKYCLKSMENRSVAHHVQTFISYDSPHQGAYVPIGLQSLIESLGRASDQNRNDPNYQQIVGVLASDAAQELLLKNIYDTGNTRSNFAAAYAGMGYPTLCNNYAITNGRVDGVGLGYPDGAQLMHIQGDRFGFHHLEDLWALNPSGGRVSVFSQTGLATWAIVNIFTHQRRITKVLLDADLNYETVPGSNIQSTVEYKNNIVANLNANSVSSSSNMFGRGPVSFIPMVSALDLNNQSFGSGGNYKPQNPFFNLAGSSAAFSSLSPFSDYYSTAANLDHLTTDPGMADYIISKVFGSTPPAQCYSVCSNIPSFSTGTLCQYYDGDVSMANFPNGVSISWSVPSGVKIVSGQGTDRIKINSSVSGTITVGVSFTVPGCTPTAYSTTVSVTPNAIPTISMDFGTDCTKASVTVSAPGATSFDWVTTGGTVIDGSGTSMTGTSSSTINITGYTSSTIKVRAYYNNSCGPSPYAEHCFEPCVGSTAPMYVTNSEPLRNEPLEASATDVSGATSYRWYSGNNLIAETPGPTLYTYDWECDGHTLICVAVTSCGLSSASYGDYNGLCSGFGFRAYPNPTTDYLMISPENTAKTTNSMGKPIPNDGFTYILYDNKGNRLRSGNSVQSAARLDLRGLKRGIYYIHIKSGKTTQKKQIVVE